MIIIERILNKFENHEQAKIEIDFCNIDKEYTVILTQNGVRSGFTDSTIELAFVPLINKVISIKGPL